MWFLAGVRMYVCVRVCVCVRFSTFETPITHKQLEISIWNFVIRTSVKQSQPFNRDCFHDNWCPICDFMEFWIFWKKHVVALTFVKFELSSQNYTQIYNIHQGTLVLNLAKIDWSVQIFSDFEFFENFFKIV